MLTLTGASDLAFPFFTPRMFWMASQEMMSYIIFHSILLEGMCNSKIVKFMNLNHFSIIIYHCKFNLVRWTNQYLCALFIYILIDFWITQCRLAWSHVSMCYDPFIISTISRRSLLCLYMFLIVIQREI